MASDKHRADHRPAMTKGEYEAYVESHGHCHSWPPVHTRTSREARQNQRSSISDGSNQVPKHQPYNG